MVTGLACLFLCCILDWGYNWDCFCCCFCRSSVAFLCGYFESLHGMDGSSGSSAVLLLLLLLISTSDLYFGGALFTRLGRKKNRNVVGVHDYILFFFFRENGKDVQSRGRAVNVRCVYMYRNGLWID